MGTTFMNESSELPIYKIELENPDESICLRTRINKGFIYIITFQKLLGIDGPALLLDLAWGMEWLVVIFLLDRSDEGRSTLIDREPCIKAQGIYKWIERASSLMTNYSLGPQMETYLLEPPTATPCLCPKRVWKAFWDRPEPPPIASSFKFLWINL